MAISFDSIPVDVRTPGQFLEVNSTRAAKGLSNQPKKILVIGTKLAAGSQVANTPVQIFSGPQAEQLFGRGSQLAAMLIAVIAANPNTELWAIGLTEPAGVAASGTFTFTGPATASGEIDLYIGGRRVAVSVANGDSATTIAAAAAAAINAMSDLPVTAAAALGVVTVTCRWKGTTGNEIDLRNSFLPGEALPAGVGLDIVAMAGGTLVPDISEAITAIGDIWYTTWIIPFTDATSLGDVETELENRWGPMVQQPGVAFAAAAGTNSSLVTLGTSRNSKQVCIMGSGKSPTPSWIWAAVVGAVDEAEPDPARPRQTLPLVGVVAPAPADRFTRSERDLLLHDGISTYTVGQDGTCAVERMVTTYQTNAQDIPDTAYLDVTTMRTLAAIRFALRARIALKYPRHKLADDGTNFGPGQAIVTPKLLRGELLAFFSDTLEPAGLVTNFDDYKAGLDVERNGTDPNRVDVLLTPDLIGQFSVFAAQIQFAL